MNLHIPRRSGKIRTSPGEGDPVITRIKPILGGEVVEALEDLHFNTVPWGYRAQ